MVKYYIIAGEASGDLHGANLVKAIKKIDTTANFRVWGGDRMKAIGAEVVKHYKDLAFMGFIEVAANLRTIMKNISFCKDDILEYNPDALILIDYPGFNLRIAEFAHEAGFRVYYYISPQVWAWKSSRVHKIRKYVDKMFVILPFEKEFYASYNYDVEYVGHPLLDMPEIADPAPDPDAFRLIHKLDDRPIIALLPGSRKQEIKRMLPEMINLRHKLSHYQFIIAATSSVGEEFYRKYGADDSISLITDNTYHLLHNAEAALVTSGTASLETALMMVPEVVCYKGSAISYQIAKRIVDVKYIALPNLIMDKAIVKELIQSEMNTKNLLTELEKLLEGKEQRSQLIEEYKILRQKLGGGGASDKVAAMIVDK